MSLRAKTLSGLKLNVASTIVSFLFQTGQLVILSRLFAPEVFGMMSLLLIVTNFSAIFLDLGVSNAIIQRKETDIKELSTLYYLNIIIGVILCLMIFLCSGLLAQMFRQPRLQTYLQWISLIYLIIPFGQQYRAIFQKRMAFNILVKIDILTTIASTVLTVILAYSGFGIYSIIWAQIAGAAFSTMLVMYFGRKIVILALPRIEGGILPAGPVSAASAVKAVSRTLGETVRTIDARFGKTMMPR